MALFLQHALPDAWPSDFDRGQSGSRSLPLRESALSQLFSYDLLSKKVYRDYVKTHDPSLVVAVNSNRHILHEGGHSIGLNHEHFHPLANISWHERFVNGSPSLGLTPEKLQRNYLRTFSLNQSLGNFDT